VRPEPITSNVPGTLAVTATADADASNSNLPPVNLSYAALFSKKMTCR